MRNGAWRCPWQYNKYRQLLLPGLLAVIRGLWPSYNLLPGTFVNSSDTIDKVNFLQVQVGPSPQVLSAAAEA